MIRGAVVLSILTLAVVCVRPTPTHAQIMGENTPGYPIRVFSVYLVNGKTYSFSTSPSDSLNQPDGGPNGDTVLSLVKWDFVNQPTTLAGADGCMSSSGFNWGPSCFSYTHSEPTGTYFLILRAWREITPAYVPSLLYKSSTVIGWTTIANWINVGGGTAYVSNTTSARRHLHTGHLPGLSDDHILLVSSTNEWEVLHAGYENGRVGETAKWDVLSTVGYPSTVVVSFGGDATAHQGNLRLLSNDWFVLGADFDGDGLSGELEADLGSCDRATDVLASGFRCDSLEFCNTDPWGDMCKARLRDTDNDGLRDDVEVYGFDDGSVVEKLARWGATPDHKDLFIEIDVYDRDTVAVGCQGLVGPGSSDRERDPELLGSGALPESHFSDRFEDVFGQMPTSWNPDGVAGVRVHHDVGISNPDPLDTRWGSFGGGNDCFPLNNAAGTGSCDYDEAAFGTDPATCGTSDPGFKPGRRWLYRYVVDNVGVWGGQGGGLVAGAAGLSGHVHETGHMLELYHEGPRHSAAYGEWSANRRPLFPSRMNYRFQDYGGPTAQSSVAAWDDIAFSFGFWDRQTNARVVEELSVVPGEDIRQLMHGWPQEGLRLATDYDVDWNDDGLYSTGNTHMAKFRETIEGRLARWHFIEKFPMGAEAFGSHHDIAVANGVMAYSYVRFDPLTGEKRVFLRGEGDGDCSVLPESVDGVLDYTKCLTIGGDWSPSSMAADGVSISPAYLSGPGLTEGLIMVWRSGPILHWREVDLAPGPSSYEIGLSFSNGGELYWWPEAEADPVLVRYPTGGTLMVFPGTDGMLYQSFLPSKGLAWSTPSIASRTAGEGLSGTNGHVGLAVYDGTVIMAAQTKPNYAEVFELLVTSSPGDGTWSKNTELLLDSSGPKPGLELVVTPAPTASVESEIHLFYRSGDETVALFRGTSPSFDNQIFTARWTFAQLGYMIPAAAYDDRDGVVAGLRLMRDITSQCPQKGLYEPPADAVCDGNGRWISPGFGGNKLSWLEFAPFATGLDPTEYCDYDEWRGMDWGLCAVLDNEFTPTFTDDFVRTPYSAPHRCHLRPIYPEADETRTCSGFAILASPGPDDRELYPELYETGPVQEEY